MGHGASRMLITPQEFWEMSDQIILNQKQKIRFLWF